MIALWKRVLERLSLFQVLGVALVLRVAWALCVPVEPVSDSHMYDVFARSIASGTGYAYPDGGLTAYWPVGTSALYAALYAAFGFTYLPITLLNIALGVLIVWLTHAVAAQYFDRRVALLSGAVVSLWPVLIQFTTVLASELPFIALVLSALYVWGRQDLPATLRAMLWGALVCGATYMRPTALVLLALLPAAQLIGTGSFRQSLVSLCVAALTAAVLFAPWVQRNHRVFGEFVLVSTNGGSNLWMGNHEGSDGGYVALPDAQYRNEAERDRLLGKQATDFIKRHPGEYLRLALGRAAVTYKAETIGIHWNGALAGSGGTGLLTMKVLSSLYWWAILLAAMAGAVAVLRTRTLPLFHVLFFVAGFLFAFPILTVAQDRYHLPVDPFLAMFAAFALVPASLRAGTSGKS
ncbi:MAG: hypothetical protein RLZZ200_2557 [Pseudomonadota bacterium]